ncbi:MAG TPA: ABC transporter ATP-binding protein [Phycisphaerae bacterium]|nr:ABC transporter ATP-binding protein [Phycisphaerae bacterium]
MSSKSRTLWKLMEGHRGRYVAALVALSVGTLLGYLSPLVVRGAIDGLLKPEDAEKLSQAALIFRGLRAQIGLSAALAVAGAITVAVVALGGALLYLKGRWAARATESIMRSLRGRLFEHLQHVTMAWHDKSQTGDVVQRCTSDVDTVRAFYSSEVIDIAQGILRILIVVPILLLLDWKMGLVAVCLMPLIVGFAFFFFKKVQGVFKKSDEAEGAMTATLQENLTGIRVVRAFARQEFEIDRFRGKNDANRAANWRLYKVLAVYWASSDFLCFTQSSLVILVGGWRVFNGTMTVGTLVAFISYGQMFIWPLREVGRVLTEVGKSLVAIGRIEEILTVPRESVPAGMAAVREARGEIEVKDLEFSYDAKTPVLRGVNLKIPAGATVAILGPSGSGKTTLVNLLLRMYEYEKGSITLDGMEISAMDRKAARAQFGAVLQEPFLFSKTIAENMRLGRHTASDEEMFAAAQVAAIHESVEGFEKRYETLVGERGVTLSGGQRQRTAIARALLRDAPILILDDALSAVDTHTEVSILDALKRARADGRKRTTIVIAHRLSTLMHADQIAVMEQGRVVQLGTHAELIARPGLYQRLWQIQSALEDDLREELETNPVAEMAEQ